VCEREREREREKFVCVCARARACVCVRMYILFVLCRDDGLRVENLRTAGDEGFVGRCRAHHVQAGTSRLFRICSL